MENEDKQSTKQENNRNPDGTFKSGISGNPGGRPKNSLKLHLQTKFADMDDEQKEAWLKDNKINAELMWRMAEGNPSTNMELSGEVKAKIIRLDV